MDDQFKDIEKEFKRLKKEYQERKISERDYKNQLKDLRITDKTGRCWTIGARTGKWYYYDGHDWKESKPPSLQDGKAICIYCGYENDLTNEACEYCGGSLGKGGYNCPKCGCELMSPSQDCPECDREDVEKVTEEKSETLDSVELETKGFTEPREDIKPPKFVKEFTWEALDEHKKDLDKKREIYFEEDEPNYIIRSIGPWSYSLFFGISGILIGIIFGVFLGISSFFPGLTAILPVFMQSQQGTLFGGVIYGVFGGIFGFICLGVIGYLLALLFNLILSFFGGIKIRLDKEI